MSITPKEVRWVARLARLELSEAEVEKYNAQLNDILNYVDQLRQLDTEEVEPLAHPYPLRNVFRPDEPRPSLPVDVALANAPQRINDYFSVPAVLESGDSESTDP